ncbi:MAG: hypothetical protein MI867_23775 [Pseudomonadales bacterium]|nr:hypothetical protein [Pseudomonadales bacterium]
MKEATHKTIQYDLIYPNGDHCQYEIEINAENLEHAAPSDTPPDWAKLEFNKCSNCPLSAEEHPTCPLASRVAPLFDFPIHSAHEDVSVKVTKDTVTINADTSVQEAYRSLVGLIMATSGCPHTAFFKPMAWFHLPFSDQEETMFRACASFLLYQFFNPADPGERSYFSDLEAVYTNIHTVNLEIAKRLKAADATSSTLNAIVVLDIFAESMLPKIRDSLRDLAFLFKTP